MSENWFGVSPEAEFGPGSRTTIDVDGVPVLVLNVDGEIYGVEDFCTHESLPLHDGSVEDGEIVCPFHGARFCLKTGKNTAPPAFGDLPTMPIKVENGMVFVRDARWD